MEYRLKERFLQLAGKYSANDGLIQELWDEVRSCYSGGERYYHTHSHLAHMIEELEMVEKQVQDWDTILFAVFYHDIIYHPQRNNNEENSTAVAAARLEEIRFPKERIEHCVEEILATKTHEKSSDGDTRLLCDADMSILGASWDTYEKYMRNVRREYIIFPDAEYRQGRIKVLKQFLAMDAIFHTEYFHHKYERQARQNIQREIALWQEAVENIP